MLSMGYAYDNEKYYSDTIPDEWKYFLVVSAKQSVTDHGH